MKVKVLLVEDDVVIAMSEKIQLEKRGYLVTTAANGKDAVTTALRPENPFDVILMDIDLGHGMDGTQAAAEILAARDIPVIFLSSHTEPEIVEKTEKITSYGYVVKNSGIVILDTSIKMALRLFTEKTERRRAEENVLASEENYRFVFMNMNSYNSLYEVVLDDEGKPCDFRFLMVNYAYERYVGKKASELVGKTLLEIYPKTESYWIDKMTEAATTGLSVNFRNFSREMNTYTEVNLYTPRKGQLAMTTANIDERRRAEEALRASDIEHRHILNAAMDGYWLVDSEGRLSEVNRAYGEMSGYAEAELLGMRVCDLESSETAEQTAIHMSKVRTESKDRFESRHRRKDGSAYDVEVSTQYLPVEGGFYVVFLRDITERKRTAAELGLRSELLSRFIEKSPIYAYIKEVSPGCSRVFRASENYVEMIGVPGSRMAGKTMEELFPADFAAKITADDWDVVSKGLVLKVDEVLNGRSYTTIKYPVTLGTKDWLAGYTIDITDRVRAQDELREQLEEKETLLREVHHRIKNNIAGIGSMISLQMGSTASEEVRAALQDSVSRIQSMRVLYDSLLATRDYREISVKSYVENLLDAIADVFASGKGIAIARRISDFGIDSRKATSLGIILNELLTNVFKYAFEGREKGTVSVCIDGTPDGATLAVHDDGIGIGDAVSSGKSSGLGLSIVRMLVRQLDGTFRIYSENGTKSLISFRPSGP